MDSLFIWTVRALNGAAFVYLFASLAFIVAVALAGRASLTRLSQVASLLMNLGFIMHTAGLLGRWYIGGIGRPPWTNLYESLIFFAWGIALFSIISDRKWRLPVVGLIAAPLVFVLMGMSVMTPVKDVEPLIPALQSNWLKIHVIFGMISYAGFTLAACFGFLHLMKNNVSLSRIGAGLALIAFINIGIAGGREIYRTGHFAMAKTVERELEDGRKVKVPDQYREYEGATGVLTRMERVPYANIPFILTEALFLVALIGLWLRGGRTRKPGEAHDLGGWPLQAFRAGVLALIGLFVAIGFGLRNSESLTLHSNPYLTLLLVLTFFFCVLWLAVAWRFEPFVRALPPAERLDELSYKNILFAFPFQTLLLITGAIWAFSAWGRSWAWDPKEIGAFVTWMAYLIYLHGKLLMRWKPNFLSVVAIIGFIILIFAFLGVNLVLSGLHTYGST